MRHGLLSALVAAALLTTAASAREKADTPKVQPVKVRILGVKELAVEAGQEITPPANQVLHLFEGRRAGNHYLLVKVRREIKPNTTPAVEDLKVQLTLRAARPVDPYAAVVYRKRLQEDERSYSAAEKRRWATEVYYFPVIRGQHDRDIVVNGKTVARVVDFYATLIIHNVDGVSSHVKLPNGVRQAISGRRQKKFQFPAGTCNLVLEVKGHGKVKVPWTKYGRGDCNYLAIIADLRNAPVIPGERLKKALAKIARACKMFRDKTGVGGGTYNVASRGQEPVHVRIDFGRGGVSGKLWRCEYDRIQVEYADKATAPKRSKKSKSPKAVKYSEKNNRRWMVRPWEKAAYVDVSSDVRKIVGETVAGRFIVRSVDKKPSTWSAGGLLSKGVLYVKDQGYFGAQAKRQGEIVVIWGKKTKEP